MLAVLELTNLKRNLKKLWLIWKVTLRWNLQFIRNAVNIIRNQIVSLLLKRHEDSILSPQPSPVKRRSCDFNFDIRHDCFYCGSSKGNQKERRYILTAVRPEEYLDRLKERTARRNDSWSWQVLNRVSNYNDLVAAEAKYHRSCMSMFYSGRDPVKKPSQAGRPPDEKRIELFDQLCNHIEDNYELVNIMNSFNNDEEFYFSENWLQQKLVSYYGEDIIVVKNPGRTNIICFKSFANKVLRTQ